MTVRVELLKRQVLTRAGLVDLCAKLAEFERSVQEAEDFTGHPFERGRAIIHHTRVSIQWCKQICALLDRAAEALDAGDRGRAVALCQQAEHLSP